jgi:hypothetical protein
MSALGSEDGPGASACHLRVLHRLMDFVRTNPGGGIGLSLKSRSGTEQSPLFPAPLIPRCRSSGNPRLTCLVSRARPKADARPWRRGEAVLAVAHVLRVSDAPRPQAEVLSAGRRRAAMPARDDGDRLMADEPVPMMPTSDCYDFGGHSRCGTTYPRRSPGP